MQELTCKAHREEAKEIADDMIPVLWSIRDLERVGDGRLTIEGETKRNEKVHQENYVRIGRRYGRFQRIFPLPEQLNNPNEIEAKLADGVLTVAIPLKESVTH
ncbi:Hsp20/alpha crystallin family protein [Candidatus Acetothermia bacterium]|nr:Hsp20/alpha crystallin family protein [Candidatus Acetothermia bacterium]